jgi:hypothetical protein
MATKLRRHPVLSIAIAAAILGIPGPVWWLLEWLFGHHHLADRSGVLESIIPFFPLYILLLLAPPNSNPAMPSSYLGAFLIALLANMALFAAVAALGTALIIGVTRIVTRARTT